MPLDEPRWWYDPAPSIAPMLLGPFGALAGFIARWRWRLVAPHVCALPVVCIGNFTAGGTGKTPLAIELAQLLGEIGETPVYLSRGHGGRQRTAHKVEPGSDTANDVGDEPLLLARVANAFVARDRAGGAKAIESAVAKGLLNSSIIVMDDGLQNPSLSKDLTIAVVDGVRGFGNGAVIPAGPLRAPLDWQLQRTDAIVISNPPVASRPRGVEQHLRRTFPGPVLEVTHAAAGDIAWIRNRPIVAFAGIGNPARFFDLLRASGGDVVEAIEFADHQTLGELNAARILEAASSRGAAIVTTEKDFARLGGVNGSCAALRNTARVLPIKIVWANGDRQRMTELLAATMKRKRSGSQGTAVTLATSSGRDSK